MTPAELEPHWSYALVQIGACSPAVAWARTQPDYATAWAACDRGDWLIWLAMRLARTLDERKPVILAACACVRPVLRHVPAGENRPRIAIETAERWCRGEATIEEVSRAAIAAARASTLAAIAAIAADVTYATYTTYAPDAARAVAYATYATDAAGVGARREMAATVRAMLPRPELEVAP